MRFFITIFVIMSIYFIIKYVATGETGVSGSFFENIKEIKTDIINSINEHNKNAIELGNKKQ